MKTGFAIYRVGETAGKAGSEKAVQVWFRHVTFERTTKPRSRASSRQLDQGFSREVRPGGKSESRQHTGGGKAMRLGGITQEVNYPTVILVGFSKEKKNNNNKEERLKKRQNET